MMKKQLRVKAKPTNVTASQTTSNLGCAQFNLGSKKPKAATNMSGSKLKKFESGKNTSYRR